MLLCVHVYGHLIPSVSLQRPIFINDAIWQSSKECMFHIIYTMIVNFQLQGLFILLLSYIFIVLSPLD